MKFPEVRPRQPLVGVALAAVAGILCAEYVGAIGWWVWLGAPVTAALALAWPRSCTCWLFTFAAFFSLHLLQAKEATSQRLAAFLGNSSRVVSATGIVWSEPEAPAGYSRTVTQRFRLKVESLHAKRPLSPRGVVMLVEWAGPKVAYGDRVSIVATASNLAPPKNPGVFDFTRYLQRQGIFSKLEAEYPSDCEVLSHGHGALTRELAMKAQHWIQARLALDLADAPEVSTLISSMVLGLVGDTPEEMKEMFQRTGTLHLFAVSGLNVAMLGTIVWFLLKPLRVPRKAAVVMIIPILIGYAFVTGLSASCVRATIMGALVLGTFLVERPPVVFNSLGAAALGILAWETNELFSAGFQFSFVLVATIVALSGRIQRRCEGFGLPDPFLPRVLWNRRQQTQAGISTSVAGAVGVTLAAWLGSLVFTAGYFHLFSPAAIVANLLAVPLAFAVLGLGLAATLSALFSNGVAILFNNANWLCAQTLLSVVQTFAALPGGHVYVELPRLAAPPECEITVLEVGDGAAVHLRAQATDWLLDCGPAKSYGRSVLPYLRSRGVNRLDGLLLSHGDAQHLGAAPELIEDFTPRIVLDSPLKDRSSTRRGLHAALAESGAGKALVRRGDVVSLSPETRLRVLYPPAGLVRQLADDKALVVRLESRDFRVLFASDCGFRTEQWLLENEPDLRADVLIKGHHSRDFSGTMDFLGRVNPQVIVCSALRLGAGLDALDDWSAEVARRGMALFRQDRCGAVQIESRGARFTLRGFVDGQRFDGWLPVAAPAQTKSSRTAANPAVFRE